MHFVKLVAPLVFTGLSSATQGFDTFLGPVFDIHSSTNVFSPFGGDDITRELSTYCENITNTSLMIAARVTSIYADEPLFSFYYSTDQNKNVDEGTVFRIGSVSKLFTIYTLLISESYDIFSRWIGDFIPELVAPTEAAPILNTTNSFERLTANWSEITIGALGSHMAGIARDYNLGDLANLPHTPGLPNLTHSVSPGCTDENSAPTCSRSDFLAAIQKRDAVFEAFQTPAYSNNAFRLLGYVVEKITNKNYSASLRSLVLEPLGLKSTFASKPQDILGAILTNATDSGWSDDIGDETPSGGLYSTVKDLCSLGEAILSSRRLSRLDTRRWLKPSAHTSSLFLSIGMPWEIYRTNISGRVVDLYCKSGSIGTYNSWLILVPDYGIVISELVASSGDLPLPPRLADIVTTRTLQVIADRQARMQRLVGWYHRRSAATTSVESDSLQLVVPSEGPGLEVRRWFSNGIDFLQVADDYSRSTGSGSLLSVRLYPAILSEDGRELRLRAVFLTDHSPKSGLTVAQMGGVPQLFGQATEAWDNVDQLTYGGQALDEFIFQVDSIVDAVTVRIPGLRVTMTKDVS
ncbi:hypothetical protein H2204_011083 [Knufia peltigerae]|uniref:Beta-lactamase-related domain-containing protein n=1 Tax=Knufia peltigerae TaxID=1002370 RepID=A0AA38XV03_9EURO|nr:hypothetical protein H2204_011083 [Knufia peltigerae]